VCVLALTSEGFFLPVANIYACLYNIAIDEGKAMDPVDKLIVITGGLFVIGLFFVGYEIVKTLVN
jgi:hypothetical protein